MNTPKCRACARSLRRESGLITAIPGLLVLLLYFPIGMAEDAFDEDLMKLIEEEQYWGTAESDAPKELLLSINGIYGKKGKLNVMVFDDKKAFETYDFLAAAGLAEASASRGSVQLRVEVNGVGPYAVFVFHDENDDKKLNMNNGKPLEGFAYSGAIDPYRAPSFSEAATVEGRADIRMTYFRKDLRLRR